VSAVVVGVLDVAARFSGVFLASFAILTAHSSSASHAVRTEKQTVHFTIALMKQVSLWKPCLTDRPCALDFVMQCYARLQAPDCMIKISANPAQ
jgi:hypothetical protein